MTTSGHWAGRSGEDELISRLYQQVTEQQAARFAAGYDVAAGLERYQAWLREHAAEDRAGAGGHPGQDGYGGAGQCRWRRRGHRSAGSR